MYLLRLSNRRAPARGGTDDLILFFQQPANARVSSGGVRMPAFILRRFLILIPTLLGVSIIVFMMLRLTPGDPAELLLGERATESALQEVREHLGLNEPLYVQYGLFLKRLMKGDLGETIWTRQQVWIEVKQRFPATIELSLVALCISCFFGVLLGIVSATRQYSLFDYLSMLGALAGVSMPIFWLGLVFMLIFSLNLGWLPISGRLDVHINLEVITNFYILDAVLTRNWEALRDALWHIIMPAVTLSTIPTAIVARMTRSSMLEVLRQDYIKTAKAKGLWCGTFHHIGNRTLRMHGRLIGLKDDFNILDEEDSRNLNLANKLN